MNPTQIARRIAQRAANEGVRPLLRRFGLTLTRYRGDEFEIAATLLAGLRELRDLTQREQDGLATQFLNYVASHLTDYPTHSQNFQDLFVLWVLQDKRDGFFVEFGATDGVELSNTWLLEERLGWRGILAEPSRAHHAKLARNRRATIDHRCVYTTTGGSVTFAEVGDTGLSSIASYAENDKLAWARQQQQRYAVETVTLVDLLAGHDAPTTIDYLSIDTEGSELDILSSFDFARFDVGVITVEHNFTAQREGINALLERNGFVRMFPQLSQADDWYVNRAWSNGRARLSTDGR